MHGTHTLAISSVITIGVVLTLTADVLLKKSGTGHVAPFVVGFLLYGFVAFPAAWAFKRIQFGSLFIIWEAAVIIVGLAAATWFYKEPFSWYRAVAVVLAGAAMVISYKY